MTKQAKDDCGGVMRGIKSVTAPKITKVTTKKTTKKEKK